MALFTSPSVCLSPQNLHRLLPKLPVSKCKYLSQTCATSTPLVTFGPLQCIGVNTRDLLPNTWQIDAICTMSPKCIHVTIDTCPSCIYALALSGEKAINAIKPLKSAIVVMGVPWALKMDNVPACASQQLNNFLGS